MNETKMPKFRPNLSSPNRHSFGFSVIEVMLAGALFTIFAIAMVGVVVQAFNSNRLGEEQTAATLFATQGLEAARSIRNQAYANLVNSPSTGLAQTGGVWTFSGNNNTFGKYTRVLSVTDVQRDGSGNIVNSGGTVDTNTKKVTSTVSWAAGPSRNNSVIQSTYLTNFRQPIVTVKGGMLVYANGGSTSDSIQYKTLSPITGTWSSAASAADIDALTTNRVLIGARLISSSTRNEKVLISKHADSLGQYIYAQVFNGSSWGNVQLLSSWLSLNSSNAQNFDGGYFNNGNFIAVFSDNTNIPKARIWNGSSWQAQTSLTSLGTNQVPTVINLSVRPGTNEAMASFFTTQSDTITQYWSGSAWSSITVHATTADSAAKRMIDFAWSPSAPTIGGLFYNGQANNARMTGRPFTANGSGGGSWGTTIVQTANQSSNMGAIGAAARPDATEFIACDKTANNQIICYEGSTVSGVTVPANNTLANPSDSGIQRSFDVTYESTGTEALAVYSDNTNIPKLKLYSPSTDTWASTATSISTGAFSLSSPVRTVQTLPRSGGDIMIALTDSNRGLYTALWNGTTNTIYTTPAGQAFSQHSTNGPSDTTMFWYDFAWDLF